MYSCIIYVRVYKCMCVFCVCSCLLCVVCMLLCVLCVCFSYVFSYTFAVHIKKYICAVCVCLRVAVLHFFPYMLMK